VNRRITVQGNGNNNVNERRNLEERELVSSMYAHSLDPVNKKFASDALEGNQA
jgi:hypothetical protein